MALTKQQTALRIALSSEAAWCALYETVSDECYDATAEVYNNIDFEDFEGTDIDGNPVDLGDYPEKKIPPIKHGFA